MTDTRILPEKFPVLETDRLILKALEFEDAGQIQVLAGDRNIAATTLLIPHPYEDGLGEEWIAKCRDQFESDKAITWGIFQNDEKTLIGANGLAFFHQHERAEMGYWIGKPYWRQGYCTEAAQAVLDFAFQTINLHRITASHFGSNPASGSVMQKLGMNYEGLMHDHVKKWDRFEDFVVYGVLNPKHQDK